MCRLCIARGRMDIRLTNREKDDALKAFVQMLKFETVSGLAVKNGSYVKCAEWILNELKTLQVDAHILPESVEGKPIVVATFMGTEPDLPGVLFNCHVDVVPVVPEGWSVPPFEGYINDGKVYGRGTQDMKCVCVQYLVAIKKLRRSGFFPKRTTFFTFVPDEEIGGVDGMNVLIESQWFNDINIGLAFDEGLANESEDTYSVFYGERLPWWIRVNASGQTGHASRFIDTTAVEQIVAVTNKALSFRQEQKELLYGGQQDCACSHAVAAARKKKSLGDVTSLNVTQLRAGLEAGGQPVINVVPPTAECSFDVRISPDMSPDFIVQKMNAWCEECTLPGGAITWDYYFKDSFVKEHSITSVDPNINPWWGLVQSFLEVECTMKVEPSVFPAASDSRFLRALGMRAIGFSPIRGCPILLHEHDEYLPIETFHEGCEVMVHLLQMVASQPLFSGDNSFYSAKKIVSRETQIVGAAAPVVPESDVASSSDATSTAVSDSANISPAVV